MSSAQDIVVLPCSEILCVSQLLEHPPSWGSAGLGIGCHRFGLDMGQSRGTGARESFFAHVPLFHKERAR